VTRLLPEMIAARARTSPDAIAVAQWDHRLSYRGLVGSAARLAARLRDGGVCPEARVAVCVRRTPSLVTAILGVLLADGAYVPLDPAYPARRLLGILNDSGAVAVVADEAGAALLAGAPVPLLPADDGAPGPADDRGTGLRPAGVLPGNAAYVMYTSGSTGRPKGVVVSHASLAAFAAAVGRRFTLGPGCRAIGFASAAFDVSVLDILVPLGTGASVQLVPERDRIDPVRLQRFLEAHRVTWGVLPPAVLPLLDPARLPGLADVLTAGEPPGPAQVARWTGQHGRRFHNWYGPTETTVCVTGAELTGSWQRPLPIGRPLPGNAAYVLNDEFEPCPPGVPGELCITGPQLARGYLGRPAQTAERFVPDPFGGAPGARVYRTGDRAVCQDDGALVFLGRLDRQVKISGQRVEVGEIEAVLCGHPRVSHAVVGLEPTVAGTQRLVAYLTPVSAPGSAEIREYCTQRLPGYMVPSRVVNVASLPLGVSGKVDLGTLRASGPVAGLWTGLLGSGGGHGAEPDDDFFASGGDSLLAMRLVAAIRAQTGRAVTVEDVFAGRTLAGIGARVAAAPAIGPEDQAGRRYGLSPGQRRLWFVERLAPGTPVHNIAFAQRLTGPLHMPAVRAALLAVARRHEVLRWRIADADGVPEVRSGSAADVPLRADDLTGLERGRRPDTLRRLLDEEASAAFDLPASPPWRARLIRLGAEEHVLAITVHHLVFDGWSQGVLYRDLSAAYRAAIEDAGPVPADGPVLAPPRRTFADYVAAQAVRGEPNAGWWTAHLDGAPHVIDLPRDRARPQVQTFRGATADIVISGDTARAISQLAAHLGATPFAVLLAAFGQLLRRLTGQHDLVVGTPFADRAEAAFDDVIGFFLHILPLRLLVTDDASFEEHVRGCAEEISAAFAHPDAPLDRLVASLGVPRDLSRNPLIQVLFNRYNFGEDRLDLPGVAAEPLRPGLPGSLFDLTLYVSESGEGMELRAVYNPDLFAAERVHALLASYATLLATVTARPGLPVRQARLRPTDGHPVAKTLPDRTLPDRTLPDRTLPDRDGPLPGWAGPGLVERAFGIACARPDTVAVTGPTGRLSYRSIAATAAAAADAVRAAGAAEGDAVAVLAARDIQLPAILLGVLASGATWAILDQDAPPLVLARQLTALRVRAVISFRGVCGGPPDLPIIDVGALAVADGATPGGGVLPPSVTGTPDTRGYLALTSGTTGEPVAVRATERSIAHFLAWYPATFGLGQDDRFALLSGLGHDPALRDMFTPLVTGARLCVPEQAWLSDPVRLAGWLRDERVTIAHLTPPLARLLTTAGRALPSVRLIALAGDQATFADVAAVRRLAPAARIVNFYGTTETPQAHGCYEVTGPFGRQDAAAPDGVLPVPAGWGIEGSQLLVLDPGGAPAGVGELGEVVIRSRHLAAGYTDPDLTSRRFTGGADRMFRTGDLGRYRPDGAVVLAGRADDQVKIRGFRVELGEVRAALVGHRDIRDGFVLLRTRDGERSLHAFAVPAHPSVRETDVLAHLRASLPGYAVPAHLTLLAALPLTANGKVDREALARTSRGRAGPAAEDPASRTERSIAAVWRDVLGLPRIGVTDNFFEIGGHSLAMAGVQARLERRLGVPVTIVDLFRYPSIRALAAHLDGTTQDPVLHRAARRTAMRRERARRWKEVP
jgi:amino acid adenylation domain-containing protein